VTKVSFYYDAEDRLAAAIVWLQQACLARRRVVVYAPEPAQADALDRALWVRQATGFFPHCRADSPLADVTPVVIAAQLDHVPHDECLLNWSDEVPPAFSRFAQLIEIVGSAADERLPARDRFKFYRDRGYELQSQKFEPASVVETTPAVQAA
jgi:DNA polymerase-3 subunit chi